MLHLRSDWSALVQLCSCINSAVVEELAVSCRNRISLCGGELCRLRGGQGVNSFCRVILQSESKMQSCAKSWGIFLAKSVNPGASCRHLSDKSRVVWKLQCRIRNCGASTTTVARALRTSAAVSSRQIERILPRHDDFAERHIGPGEREKREMLDVLGLEVRFTFSIQNKMGSKIRVHVTEL